MNARTYGKGEWSRFVLEVLISSFQLFLSLRFLFTIDRFNGEGYFPDLVIFLAGFVISLTSFLGRSTQLTTVRTRINDHCARSLELPLLVRSGGFSLFFCLGGVDFW